MGAAALITVAALPALAAEGDDRLTTDLSARAATSGSAGAFLPTTIAPRVGAQSGLVVVTSGYDGSHRSLTMSGAADLRVWGPVAVRAGFTSMPNGENQPFQPHFGLRVQILRQGAHGIDGAVGVFYRMERFVEDEGKVEAMASVGRQFGKLGLFTNVSYGQDPEGDDREGEVRAAALYALGSAVHVGVDGRLRVDLFSSDPRRVARSTSNLDFAVGPLASVSLGRFALIGQLGATGVRVARLETGLLATVGVAAVF
jgi:hypothetical protein